MRCRMETKKYAVCFTIPKDAFIDDRPIDPQNPFYRLAAHNMKVRCTAKMMGWQVVGRMAVYSSVLDEWMPIGPSSVSSP